MGPPGFDAEDPEYPWIVPGPAGAKGDTGAPGGGGGSWAAFTKDLGAARRSGTFDVTGVSGLTGGAPVQVVQTAAAITSKGDAQDEPEMDQIVVTARALDATSFRAYWFSAAQHVVVGTYAFAWK